MHDITEEITQAYKIIVENMSSQQDTKQHIEYCTDPIPRQVILYYSKLILDLAWSNDSGDGVIENFSLKKFSTELLEKANN